MTNQLPKHLATSRLPQFDQMIGALDGKPLIIGAERRSTDTRER